MLKDTPPQVHQDITCSHNFRGVEGEETEQEKNGVGSIVKAKVGELGEVTREGRSRSTRKEVMGCVQDVVGKKKFPVQFKYRKKKEIIYSLLFLKFER